MDGGERARLYVGQRGRRNEDEPRLGRKQVGALVAPVAPMLSLLLVSRQTGRAVPLAIGLRRQII